MKNLVYIILHEMNYEGYTVEAVCGTHERAVRRLKEIAEASSYKPKQVTDDLWTYRGGSYGFESYEVEE